MKKILVKISDNKKYIEDIMLSILSNGIPLIILQLIILPLVNSDVGEELYGLLITIISVFTFVASTSAGSLNNVRLILNEKYEEENIKGDFNLIQVFFAFGNALLVVVISFVYTREWSPVQIFLLVLVTLLICAEGYYSVGFRLQINYKRRLIQKILLTLGYVIGFFLYRLTEQWLLIYVIGYLLDVIYVLRKTDLIKEPWSITKFFPIAIKNEAVLIIASLIGGLTMYIDRLIIYPIYGGLISSTYYVATLLGKVISLAIVPISGVLLSYFAKIKKLEDSILKKMRKFSWVVGIIGYIVCLIVSRPILGLLYPTIVDDAMVFVPVTLVCSVIDVQNTMMSPVVLKYCKITKQIWISLINVVGYLVISIVFMQFWGLMGFCVGGIVTALIKYIIYSFMYSRENRNNSNQEAGD